MWLRILLISSVFAFTPIEQLNGMKSAWAQESANSSPPFVIHSRDYPNPLWPGLDATITEIDSDDRSSLFSVDERDGNQGAGAIGRFFLCTVIHVANQRGANYFANSNKVNGTILAVYLNSIDDDIEEIVKPKFEKYELYESATQVQSGLLHNVCAMFLGDVSSGKHEYEKAIGYYTEAIEFDPKYARGYFLRGYAHDSADHYESAISDYDRAIEIDPEYSPAYNNKARILATCKNAKYRNGSKAVHLAEKAMALSKTPNHPNHLFTLAAAYAEAGRFPDAISTQEKLIEILEKENQRNWLRAAREDLALFKKHKVRWK